MIFDAPAKLNLFLRVLAQESTGFHQIETLFCALELCDELDIERSTHGIDIRIAQGDSSLPSNHKDNLIHRAATAFFEKSKLDGGATIKLTKRIPIGAGLGGGSSDAAATLAALNELYARPLTTTELIEIGAALGSDIPFFMCGSPLALAWARGTRMLPLTALPQMSVLLVAPGESVSTAVAYNALAESRTARNEQDKQYSAPPAIHDASGLRHWNDVALNAVNDFEPVIFERIPELEQIKADLGRHGARLALLTGTGSVVFGIFDNDAAAESAERAIKHDFRNLKTIITRTRPPLTPSPSGH